MGSVFVKAARKHVYKIDPRILNDKVEVEEKPSFATSLKASLKASFRKKESDEKSEGTQTVDEKAKESETGVDESNKPLLKNDDNISVDPNFKNVVVSVL